MHAQARKRIAAAILRSYPDARISWSGEARIVTLHVATSTGGDEKILSIDTAYASDDAQVAQLVEDVLSWLS